MAIRVKFLNNHGCVVTGRRYGKPYKRFVRPNGALKICEAVAVLKTNDMRFLRLARAGKLRVKMIRGEKYVPLSEIKRLKGNRHQLYPGRGAA
jgi:hypothetical protein